MKILFIILPIVLLIGSFIWAWCSYKNLKQKKEREVEKTRTTWGGKEETYKTTETYIETRKSRLIQLIASLTVSIASLFVLVLVPGSIHQVDAGQVAVVKVWGDAKEVRTAGIHFDLWISHKYEIYDAKVQQTIETTQAYSNDGQTMDVEIVIQYQIQQENTLTIAKNYGGLEMLESRIGTVSIEKTKSVLSQKSAMNIIETRATVSADVEESIRNAITADYCVNITTVVLTDISFSDAFEKTVEDKMIAEQEKLKAEYEKEKAIIQAEQALEVAKLEAEAKLAEAEGEAKAIQELAKAQANSIKVKSIEVARMLGFEIIETATEEGIQYEIQFEGESEEHIAVISEYLKYVEYLEVWNGELPDVITGDSATIMIPTV